MKKTYKIIIVLLILIPAVFAAVRLSVKSIERQTAADKKMVEEFTGVWLGHSSVNEKIPELIKQENTPEREKAYDELIKEGYENYMTGKARKGFAGQLIAIPLELTGKYGEYTLTETTVTKERDNYVVRVTLQPQGKNKPEHHILFEVKTQSGKINWVSIKKGIGNK